MRVNLWLVSLIHFHIWTDLGITYSLHFFPCFSSGSCVASGWIFESKIWLCDRKNYGRELHQEGKKVVVVVEKGCKSWIHKKKPEKVLDLNKMKKAKLCPQFITESTWEQMRLGDTWQKGSWEWTLHNSPYVRTYLHTYWCLRECALCLEIIKCEWRKTDVRTTTNVRHLKTLIT